MDATPQAFANRCLPLMIANAHGWEILSPCGFQARWDGGTALSAVTVEPVSGADAALVPHVALSHFGSGVLTFHVNGLFRTDPGYDLFVGGPINASKDGISALTGVVETDWASATFTMNWRFTRPGAVVRFEKDEPFCHIFPVPHAYLEDVQPEMQEIADAPDIQEEYEAWSRGRSTFLADLQEQKEEALKLGWEKTYFRGLTSEGRKHEAHRTKLGLKPFKLPER